MSVSPPPPSCKGKQGPVSCSSAQAPHSFFSSSAGGDLPRTGGATTVGRRVRKIVLPRRRKPGTSSSRSPPSTSSSCSSTPSVAQLTEPLLNGKRLPSLLGAPSRLRAATFRFYRNTAERCRAHPPRAAATQHTSKVEPLWIADLLLVIDQVKRYMTTQRIWLPKRMFVTLQQGGRWRTGNLMMRVSHHPSGHVHDYYTGTAADGQEQVHSHFLDFCEVIEILRGYQYSKRHHVEYVYPFITLGYIREYFYHILDTFRDKATTTTTEQEMTIYTNCIKVLTFFESLARNTPTLNLFRSYENVGGEPGRGPAHRANVAARHLSADYMLWVENDPNNPPSSSSPRTRPETKKRHRTSASPNKRSRRPSTAGCYGSSFSARKLHTAAPCSYPCRPCNNGRNADVWLKRVPAKKTVAMIKDWAAHILRRQASISAARRGTFREQAIMSKLQRMVRDLKMDDIMEKLRAAKNVRKRGGREENGGYPCTLERELRKKTTSTNKRKWTATEEHASSGCTKKGVSSGKDVSCCRQGAREVKPDEEEGTEEVSSEENDDLDADPSYEDPSIESDYSSVCKRRRRRSSDSILRTVDEPPSAVCESRNGSSSNRKKNHGSKSFRRLFQCQPCLDPLEQFVPEFVEIPPCPKLPRFSADDTSLSPNQANHFVIFKMTGCSNKQRAAVLNCYKGTLGLDDSGIKRLCEGDEWDYSFTMRLSVQQQKQLCKWLDIITKKNQLFLENNPEFSTSKESAVGRPTSKEQETSSSRVSASSTSSSASSDSNQENVGPQTFFTGCAALPTDATGWTLDAAPIGSVECHAVIR